MGTRADFYIGTGANAEWLGSVGWNGYEWAERTPNNLLAAKTEEAFRGAIRKISEEHSDWTSPEDGWPWPWDDSSTTDYTYYFVDGAVSFEDRDDWPDMSSRKNVAYGPRSGLVIVG